ncbi:hypothetical protein Trydic_g20664 [Trypoxylus dichotomus]
MEQHQLPFWLREHYIKLLPIVKSDFYMDDLISGADTIEQAIALQHQIEEILCGVCLPLRKWRTNQPELLANHDLENTPNYLITDDGNSKTLGLCWDPRTDSLSYSLSLEIQQVATKHTVLSTMSRIFDPLGLISPIVVRIKLLLQQIWQSRIEWDESLPMHLDTGWKLLQRQLIEINNIRVPRQVAIPNLCTIELNGFSDASEQVYGACIYIRTTDGDGKHSSRLVTAKSRVSPLKVVALPRLELCGALLLTRLMSKTEESIKKTFVANRVADIQDTTTRDEWRHIKSEANPADIVSRGANPSQLLKSDLWWSGPSLLLKDKEHWPSPKSDLFTGPDDMPERRKEIQIVLISIIMHLFLTNTALSQNCREL